LNKYVSKTIFLENIKNIGITLRINKPSLIEYFLLIKQFFQIYNVNLFLEEKSALMIQNVDNFDKSHLFDVEIMDIANMCDKSDILVCCGGDGTLLNLVRNSYLYQKPILGIKGGSLSFLLNVKVEDLDIYLKHIFLNNFKVSEHMMIKLQYKQDTKLKNIHIFNDIVLKNVDVFGMVDINLFINDEMINSYRGDGLIISTPTGSTAYNLSAQGPIVHPLNKAIIVTPINPQGLTQNPIVLPYDFKISVQSPNGDIVVIVDGHSSICMQKGEKFDVFISEYSVDMIHAKNNEYMKSLKEKLFWGA